MFGVFIKYPLDTLRRSPLEQYSMAKRGKSFKAMELNSSGTSLAWTTLTWLSLQKKRVEHTAMVWKSEYVQRSLGYFVNTTKGFTLTSSLSEFPCSSGLCSWSSALGGKASQQSYLLTPVSTQKQYKTKPVTHLDPELMFSYLQHTGEYMNLQDVGTGRHAQSLPSPVSPSFPTSRRAGSV